MGELMKNNKKILTIIIVLIIIVIFAIAGVAYTYFYTDVFKTDKQKFFKYVSQNSEIFSGLGSEELTQYYAKKDTNGYKYDGEFSAQIDEQTASLYMPNQRMYSEVEKSKIIFEGEKDKQNQYSHGTIAMKYSNGEKMEFEYINKEDYYGLKIDKILKKYLVLENNNLEDFAQKLQIPISSTIPDKVEAKNLDSYNLTDEEKKTLHDKIYKILDENLTDAMFKEEKLGDNLKYTLSLTALQIENISSEIYETIINDEIVVNKLKQFFIQELEMSEDEADEQILELKKSAEEYKEQIKKDIEEYDSDESLATELIQISIYTNKGILINTELVTDEARFSLNRDVDKLTLKVEKAEKDGESIVYNPLATVSLEKLKELDSIAYKFLIAMDEDASKIEFDANYKGIQDLDDVKEQYTLQIEKEGEDEDEDYSLKYVVKNDVSFEDEIEEEDVISNGVKINNYDEAKLQSTLEKIVSMVVQLNKKQMEALGLEEDENPIMYMFPIFDMINGTLGNANNIIESTTLGEQEIMAFNAKFTPYESSNMSGAKVNTLIQVVLSSNASNENQVTLIIDGVEYNSESSTSNKSVEAAKTYKVSLKYKDGIVNQIEIIENN